MDAFLDKSIFSLNLDSRYTFKIFKALEEEQINSIKPITTLRDVKIECSEKSLLEKPGFGKKTLKSFKKSLSQIGVKLRKE